jgi:hypothetical protein
MQNKKFDLNIEHVLENWEVEHAVREIIANALDETALSGCRDIEIAKDPSGRWTIRDFGRGLRIEHFTMNENVEKLAGKGGVIGKFGVGLKDAVATLNRHGIAFGAESAYGQFRVEESGKVGFDGIRTLHVDFASGPAGFEGTRFLFENLPDDSVARAKALFLRFSNIRSLETVAFGQILERSVDGGAVFIHGVKVSEEPNFLFSYNITSLTDALRKRLNRERTNVGRVVYADRIKTMLRDAKSEAVLSKLVEQAEARGHGEVFDEMKWIEVAQKALAVMSGRKRVIYVTESEALEEHDILDHARRDGYIVTIVTELEKAKLIGAQDRDDRTIFVGDYRRSYNESFNYDFVDFADLHSDERNILGRASGILACAGVPPHESPRVLISETMRFDADATLGVWDASLDAIVIRRTQLHSLEAFAGTLLHEVVHARTGFCDISREFEEALTDFLGKVATWALNSGLKGPDMAMLTQAAAKSGGMFSRLFRRGARP